MMHTAAVRLISLRSCSDSAGHKAADVFRRILHCLVLILSISISTSVHAAPKLIRIGIVLDEPSDYQERAIVALAQELDELGGSEFIFDIASSRRLMGRGERSSIRAAISSLMQRSDVDLIICLGPIGSDTALTVRKTKPVIAAAVISPELQNFPATAEGTSGVENLHYLGVNVDLAAALKRFQASTGAKKLAVVVEDSTLQGLAAVAQSLESVIASNKNGSVIVGVDYASDERLRDLLPSDVEAVFMLPQLARTNEQRALQIDDVLSRGLPSLSTMGQEDAEAGFTYAISLIPNPEQLARRLAVDIRDIALGRSAGSLLVAFTPRDRLTVNLAVARALQLNVPFDVLFEANMINELGENSEVFTLNEVIEQSLSRNLDIAIAQQDLESAYEDTNIARSSLLPQLNAELSYEAFDDDLALIPSFIPNETTTASVNLSQSIYSETNLSSYRSTRFLQDGQEADFRATRLNVIQSTANAYLNLLIAKTEREIQRDNIRLTRANLERAQFRYRVGSANRSEVFRFETVLASDLQAIAGAQANYQRALFELNEILRAPINRAFAVAETGVESTEIFGDARLAPYVNGPANLAIFADFLSLEALENSPELDELNSQIASQERLLLAAKRRRYVPTIDFVSSVEEVIDNDGASMPRDYDEDWRVGIELSLPLFEGAAIEARKRQARVQLRRLELARNQTELSLETGTRNAVTQASASRLSIDFAKQSERAALRTLNLVTDSYTRGRSKYIDLIDAQSSYLTERLAAANATYEYLLDLVALQRSIGFFDFTASDDFKDRWFARLQVFSQERK